MHIMNKLLELSFSRCNLAFKKSKINHYRNVL